jgi:hypothetical protein
VRDLDFQELKKLRVDNVSIKTDFIDCPTKLPPEHCMNERQLIATPI